MQGERRGMYGRTVSVPTMIAAAVLVACAAALLAISEKAEAAFPGKNGKIAFSSNLTAGVGVDNPEGDYEIFTIEPDGTNLTQLTRNATDDRAPDWSADGGRIAYAGHDGNDYEIYTMSMVAGGATRVTDNYDDDYDPAFSPDGNKIAYRGLVPVNEENPDWKVGSILVVPSSGGAPTPVLVSNADGPYYGPGSPAWSPDGDRLAYVWDTVGGEGYSRVEVLNLSGAWAWTGTSYAGTSYNVFSERSPEWSPDGSRIAYEGYDRDADLSGSIAADAYDIYAVGAGDGTPVALTDAGTRGEHSPAWSPDGKKIAFSAQDGDATSGSGQMIYTIPAGGGAATSITGGLGVGNIESLDWQPLPGAPGPIRKAECKKGGYKEFGLKNQGRCIAFVKRVAHDW
jgi:Tol biopolymer transport system component